jgi:hypothetical protein
MKFRHRSTNRFGQRLSHLVETLGVRDVNAGKLDGNRGRLDRA